VPGYSIGAPNGTRAGYGTHSRCSMPTASLGPVSGRLCPDSYRLPNTPGKTYRVTLAITDPADPNWIVSTFVTGAPRTVTEENQGRFTGLWIGLFVNRPEVLSIIYSSLLFNRTSNSEAPRSPPSSAAPMHCPRAAVDYVIESVVVVRFLKVDAAGVTVGDDVAVDFRARPRVFQHLVAPDAVAMRISGIRCPGDRPAVAHDVVANGVVAHPAIATSAPYLDAAGPAEFGLAPIAIAHDARGQHAAGDDFVFLDDPVGFIADSGPRGCRKMDMLVP